MKIRKCVFVLLWLAPFLSKAQTKSSLVLIVKAYNPIIRIDTTLFHMSHGIIEMENGSHVIKVWAPRKKLLVDTIYISSGKINFYQCKLEDSDFFKENKRKYYKMKYLPLKATLVYTAGAAAAYFLNKQALDKNEQATESAYSEYLNTVSLKEIDRAKSEYREAKDKFESSRVLNNLIVITSAVAIPFGVYACFHFNKKQKKIFGNEKPLLSLQTDYKNNFLASLNIQF